MATKELSSKKNRNVSILLSWISLRNLRAVKFFLEPLPLHERRNIVSLSNQNQSSLLNYAVYKGSLSIVRYLIIDCGADVNTVTRGAITSTTPLFIAISFGNIRMVRLLVKLGADLAWKNMSMENALVYACKYQHIRMAVFLKISGGKIESDRNIYLCAKNPKYCALSIILGTSPNCIDSKHDSIFILASEKGNIKTMNLLRQFDVDIYFRNRMCHNALSAAIWRKQMESYRYLILNRVYNDLDIALAFELCGARMILFQSRYDEALDLWRHAVHKRLSVSGGPDEKLKYYRDNGIKQVKEFQTRADLQKLRGNIAACIEQAHLVYTRIRNPPG